MTRYTLDAIDELRRLQERMTRLFEELPGGMAQTPPESGVDTQMPYVDVLNRDNDVIVTADLPGVDKGDIMVNVRDDILEIKARRTSEQEQKDQGYIRHERSYKKYYRSIKLPAPVDRDRAKASFSNGVLEITLPKTQKAEIGSVPIS
jgi:HSP20 family protein